MLHGLLWRVLLVRTGAIFAPVENIALKVAVIFLSEKRNLFEPNFEGLPVNEGNDPEGDERVFCGEKEEVCGREGATLSRESADQCSLGAFVVIDVNREAFSGDFKPEIKIEVHFREW